MNRKRVTVNLDPADYESLTAFAKSQDRSLSWIISYAVKAMVAKVAEDPLSVAAGMASASLAGQTELAAAVKGLLQQQIDGKPQAPASLASIDLFSGAGGLSLGLERAGFHPEMAIDFDADSCETYAAAFPKVRILNRPIEDVSFKEFSGIDLIAGGPPCQPFSSGGKRLAQADPRDMVPQFIRAVKEAKPRAFLMENVAGLFGGTHEAYFLQVLEWFRGLGYRVMPPAVLNAADFGAPQKRRRGFLVGLLNGNDFALPSPTHGPGTQHAYVPAKSVISDERIVGEPNPSRVFYAKNPDIRPSPYDGHVFNGGGRPIDLDAPCHTILASAGGNKTHFIDTLGLVPKYHKHLQKGGKPKSGVVKGARRLTPEESALIQTFPPGMEFRGARSSRYKQIGNAVPPLLAEAIGRKLKECLS